MQEQAKAITMWYKFQEQWWQIMCLNQALLLLLLSYVVVLVVLCMLFHRCLGNNDYPRTAIKKNKPLVLWCFFCTAVI